MEQAEYESKGIKYLSDLGTKLKDLSGYSALARELLQNADDAKATSLTLTVGDDGLVVENNAQFSDCGAPTGQPCRKVEAHLCDFHRFKETSGGGKRDQRETIGAFGIGFTAVYQITDEPELISGSRHWTIREYEEESRRIRVCKGCAECAEVANARLTRFILPWARNPESRMREGLRSDVVAQDIQEAFGAELRKSLPLDLLFLRNTQRVEVRDHQGSWKTEREPTTDGIRIQTSAGLSSEWLILDGGFERQAEALKLKYPTAIDQKKEHRVQVAVPGGKIDDGLLFAFLPTEQRTRLPFHIHADFVPQSSRKSVDLVPSNGAPAEWNRAALESAAHLVAGSLDKIRRFLDPEGLWALLDQIKQASAEQHQDWATWFWAAAKNQAQVTPCVPLCMDQWAVPRRSFYPEDWESVGVQVLETLGMPLVMTAVRPFKNCLAEVGVQRLTRGNVAQFLRAKEFNRQREVGEIFAGVERGHAVASVMALGAYIGQLRQDVRQQVPIGDLAFALGTDGVLWPLKDALSGSDETAARFDAIATRNRFAAQIPDGLQSEVPECRVPQAIAILEGAGELGIDRATREGKVDPSKILRWFADRPVDIDDGAAERISQLPIFPSENRWVSLRALSLPSAFKDRLGLSGIVDVDKAGVGEDFLRRLGARPLDIATYARHHARKAFEDVRHFGHRNALLADLAAELGKLKEHQDVRRALDEVACIPCSDGEYRRPSEVHLASPEVHEVLGDVPVFVPTSESPALLDFVEWLGTARRPRPERVLERIRSMTSAAPTPSTVSAIHRIVQHCSSRQDDFRVAEDELRELSWLPAEGNTKQWFRASELDLVFQRHLFESEGRFLDLPHASQSSASTFLQSLGANAAAPLRKIVGHLIYLANNRLNCPPALYASLVNQLGAQEATRELGRLKGIPCLQLGANSWWRPEHVYWSDAPPGQRRRVIGGELRPFGPLFSRLGVKDAPDGQDGEALLMELAEDVGRHGKQLTEDDKSACLGAWKLIEEANFPATDAVWGRLAAARCYPNSKSYLAEPKNLLIGDSPRLVDRFSKLEGTIVARIEGVHNALGMAGARQLSKAAEVDLLEVEPVGLEDLVRQRFVERLPAIIRILGRDDGIKERLPGFVPVGKLLVRWTISAFKQRFESDPEEAQAQLIHGSDGPSIFYLAAKPLPWLAIARELASFLWPNAEVGTLAPALKEVLEAPSLTEAKMRLDDMGFHSMSIVDAGPEQEPAAHLGGPDDLQSGGPVPPVPPASPPAGPLEVPPAPSPPAPASVPERSEGPQDGTFGPINGLSEAKSKKRQGRKEILRSYVLEGDHPLAKDVGDEDPSGRTEIDQAAVSKAMEYERRAGRVPKEMPHHNKGYDIESRDPSGTLLRFIEVKGTGDSWDRVKVSRAQFDFAIETGDASWLYVVERATAENAEVTPIGNFARRVSDFLVDNGWRSAAGEPPEGPDPGDGPAGGSGNADDSAPDRGRQFGQPRSDPQ